MRLTSFTDYGFRVLIYLALRSDRLSTIHEISENYGISKNHLMKVVHMLARNGFVKTVRGKGGGMSLARPAHEICVGEVVRLMEEGMAIVECFDPETGCCRIDGACNLKGILAEARDAFLHALDQYTLADAVSHDDALRVRLFGPEQPDGDGPLRPLN